MKTSLIVFALTMALCVLLLTLLPRKYGSEAKLLVRVGRESVGLDPTATPNEVAAIREPDETEIQSILDVMQSRAVLATAVDLLGTNNIFENSSGSEQDRTKAIDMLKGAISIDGGRSSLSRVITVHSRFRSPQAAQTLLQGFLDAFLVKHLQANRASGSYDFFLKQIDTLKQRLAESSAALRDGKNELDLVTVESERNHIDDRKGRIKEEIGIATSELASTEAAVNAVEQQLADLPERMVTQEVSGLSDDPFGSTLRRLFELQIREKELLSKYTEHHAMVLSVRQQINQAKQILAQQKTPSSLKTNAVNPTFQQLRMTLLTDMAKATSLRARIGSLRNQYQELKDQLKALNEHEGHIVRLKQNVAVLNKVLVTYSEKLEHTRMDRTLQSEGMSNINVFQPPTLIRLPVFPKTEFFLLFGLMLGATAGVGSAFAREYVDSLRKPGPSRELESHSFQTTTECSGDPIDSVAEVTRLVEQTH
jgi:uncharacterized protein involved in exopolysaccharide biosynthesis